MTKTLFRRGSWFVTVPLAVIAVAYVMLFFLPGNRAIDQLGEQIEQKQQYIAQAATLTTALQVAQEELEKVRQYNETWQTHAPAQGETSALHATINTLAVASGTDVTRLDPEEVILYDKVRQAPLSVECTGSFGEVFEFLRGLEGLPAEIWVDLVNLEKLEQTRESVKCELTLVVFANNPENSD